jgi:hypothetical protein
VPNGSGSGSNASREGSNASREGSLLQGLISERDRPLLQVFTHLKRVQFLHRVLIYLFHPQLLALLFLAFWAITQMQARAAALPCHDLSAHVFGRAAVQSQCRCYALA